MARYGGYWRRGSVSVSLRARRRGMLGVVIAVVFISVSVREVCNWMLEQWKTRLVEEFRIRENISRRHGHLKFSHSQPHLLLCSSSLHLSSTLCIPTGDSAFTVWSRIITPTSFRLFQPSHRSKSTSYSWLSSHSFVHAERTGAFELVR